MNLTPSALTFIKSSLNGKSLRIAVTGGGCSGLQYALSPEDAAKEDDRVFEVDGMDVFIDPKSFPYLQGLIINYEGGLNGSGLTFSNPNAQKQCGCGTSFSL